jgi:hypothetical protein
LSDAARSGARALAAALRTLHRRLLLATQKSFEKLHGRVDGPGALLQLAVHDPLFAWLRPVSEKVALLDELAEAEDLGADDLTRAATEVAELVEADSAFRAAYLVYLQAEPDVVLAHAALRRLITGADPRHDSSAES